VVLAVAGELAGREVLHAGDGARGRRSGIAGDAVSLCFPAFGGAPGEGTAHRDPDPTTHARGVIPHALAMPARGAARPRSRRSRAAFRTRLLVPHGAARFARRPQTKSTNERALHGAGADWNSGTKMPSMASARPNAGTMRPMPKRELRAERFGRSRA